MVSADNLNWLQNWSIEVTPQAGSRIKAFDKVLPRGTTVNITSLPGEESQDIRELIQRLMDQGMNPVPHIATRGIQSTADLACRLKSYSHFGVTEILVIGGDISSVKGPFHNTADLIETGIFENYGIHRLGVAGHPEGSPNISDDELQKALDRKNELAVQSDLDIYIETQFCFDPKPIIAWEEQTRLRGNQLPIRIGLAGPAKLSTLIRFGLMSGVGPSIQFLKKQASKMAELLITKDPSEMINALTIYQAKTPNSCIDGVHFYPFGGFEKTAQYASGLTISLN